MKTSPPALEQIILKLIESHLIHTRLVSSLPEEPIVQEGHNMDLERVIFSLMGFREHEITDEFIEWYFSVIESAAMEIISKEDYEHQAGKLYMELKSKIQFLY